MGYQARAGAARRPAHAVRLCVYCGIAPGTTQDHVPPKTLFPKPRPSSLVKVPCCEPCRQQQSKDDEYFKSRVALRHDVGGGPLGSRLTDPVLRAFARPEARGFAANLLQSMREVEVRTAAGLYLGHVMTYHADLQRLDAVMRRTLLGLYYHEMGMRLPDTVIRKNSVELKEWADSATLGSRKRCQAAAPVPPTGWPNGQLSRAMWVGRPVRSGLVAGSP